MRFLLPFTKLAVGFMQNAQEKPTNSNGLGRMKQHFAAAAFPLCMGAFLTIFAMFAPILGLPNAQEITEYARKAYENWGAWGILLSAFLEGLYMVSFYYPGSMVIVLAVIFSPKDILSLASITAVCWLAFMAATMVNYALGYYGFYKIFDYLGGRALIKDMHTWMSKFGHYTTFAAAFDPNYLAITNVCMGISRQPLWKALVYSGVSMMVSGPVLTYLAAKLTWFWIDKNGTSAFTFSIILFYVWAAFAMFWSIWKSNKIASKTILVQ